MSLNQELARLFHSMSQIMEIKGENVFKVLAFQKVGRVLDAMTADVRESCEQGTMREVEGIGESSCKIIEEYVKTGRSSDYETLAASLPAGLLPMLDIPGLGPKTINLFWKAKGITNLEELVKALEDPEASGLKGLKGIGDKKLETIKQGIALRSSGANRLGIVEALPIGEALVGRLRALKQVKQAEIAGSLRRRRETIGDVDLLCCLKDSGGDGTAVADAFVAFPEVEKVLGQGSTKASVRTAGGLQVDLRIVPADNFGAALLYFTGSNEHNVKLRGLALDNALTLYEWGHYNLSEYEPVSMAHGGKERGKAAAGKADKKTGQAPAARAVASRTEEEVYGKLGLQFIEPELREDRGEIEAAAQKTLPKLIQLKDIRGDLHSHTVASDGVATIEQMAQAAKERGYEYLAITDHSKSQVIANGLTRDRLLRHVRDIRKAAERFKWIKLLAGCEVDILVDGRLDFEPEVLAELDYVVASPHVSLSQDEKKATDRLLRAIESRYVNVIGHPTGRLINRRQGLPLQFDRLFRAAAATGTALEINAGWPRLDLSEHNARAAIEAGVKLSIDTDAHSVDALEEMAYGVNVARRAWATKTDVINCMTWDDLNGFIARKR
jgi:DNA polymerase (family 10)